MKKQLSVRLFSAALALVMCLLAAVPALAAREDYTMAGKLLKQLWAGSGFSGTLEVELIANPAAGGNALTTEKPFLIDWDYIYVRPTAAETAQHRLDAVLLDGEAPVTEAHFQLKDGLVSLTTPLLGEGWWTVEPQQLLHGAAGEDSLAAQLAPGIQSTLQQSGMPGLLQLLLPQLLRWQENQSGLQALLEQMTLRMDLWIEGYRQNAELDRLEDGSPIITVNYVVSPASIKAQAKQMVLDVLSDEAARTSLTAAMDTEMALLLLNPSYQPYYFAAIDQLPLSGDLLLSRTVDMKGATTALHLSLPFYDAEGGAVTLMYDRVRGEGDLPDTNTVTMESQQRSMALTYLTYRSLTDVTVYQGTFKVEDSSAESFAVQPEGQEKQLPEIAFTLSHQITESREDGDLNVYTTSWQLQLEPDPSGKEPDAFQPVQIQLDGRFASKTPQTSATKADITLSVSGEQRPQQITLRFSGETRRQWEVEELPQQRSDLLALTGEGLEELLATLLTEGGKAASFFLGNTAAAEPDGAQETLPEAGGAEEAAPAAEGAPAPEGDAAAPGESPAAE